ncbi:hypothetical protein NMG60_11026297 [Bertholletia excelsa]
MNATLVSLTKPFTTSSHVPSVVQNHRPRSTKLLPIKSGSGDGNKATSSDGGNASPPVPPPITPPETVEIRFRRGSRKRSKRQQKQQDGATNGLPNKAGTPAPKDWESMTLTEKAMELYMGEKGLLFWLNKFAYASIFIIIGGWILFRFVGPALNLYQLDSPPLSPTSMFKGS